MQRTLDGGAKSIKALRKFVVFLLDGSSSLSPNDFDRQKAIVNSITKKLNDNNSNGDNQYCVVQFSTYASVHRHATSNPAEVQSSLDAMVQIRGNTDMAAGLREAKTLFLTEDVSKTSERFLFMFTDGVPNDRYQAQVVADELKMVYEVKFCCMGVGMKNHIDESMIHQLASSGLGGTVADWDGVAEKVNELLGLSVSPSESFRVIVNMVERPLTLGDTVILDVRIQNKGEEVLSKGSKLYFKGNAYFDSSRFNIKEDVKENEWYKQVYKLYPNDNVTIEELEQTLPYEILSPTKEVLFKGSVSFWASDFCRSLIDFKPLGVPIMNIGLFGTMSSGKSSFYNSIHTLLDATKSDVVSFSTTAASGDHVTTKICRYNLPNIFSENPLLSTLKYNLWDTYGLTPETYNQNEFKRFINGELPHEYDMNSQDQIVDAVCDPLLDKRIHSIIFVLSQGDRGDDELLRKLRSCYLEAIRCDLQPLVIITKVDQVRGSESMETIKKDVSKAVGVPHGFIFTVENYQTFNKGRSFEIDKNTFTILEMALNQGNNFLKLQRNN